MFVFNGGRGFSSFRRIHKYARNGHDQHTRCDIVTVRLPFLVFVVIGPGGSMSAAVFVHNVFVRVEYIHAGYVHRRATRRYSISSSAYRNHQKVLAILV